MKIMIIIRLMHIIMNNVHNTYNRYNIIIHYGMCLHDVYKVPGHLQVLRAHRNRFGLLAGVEGLGFQIDKHGTHIETLQICPVDTQVLDSYPISLRHHVLSSDNQGHRIPLAVPHHQPRYAQFVVEPI